MSRFNRSNFYPKVVIDGVTLNDFVNSYYNRYFIIKRPLGNYTIKQQDVQRPDLICYKIYGTTNYWWMLMRYNNIFDIWNDLYIGQTLNTPNSLDFDDFFITVSKAK